MIRHVVMFRWSETATEEQKQAALEQLDALRERVPGIRRLSFGTDLGVQPGNFDLALIAEFDDVAGYERYRDHEAHQTVVTDYVRPITAERAAVQHDIAPDPDGARESR